ncbi:hypothetical protein CDAR_523091 [Caerostris darwini]|uniref:Uncharacterized protein n=1 Tax=Caerostris darwini TaxID=1538125 RepID=A0AAV4TIG6_9ARAC|nr:hypothetical protein CDAR_523091 [Caerostris darwini]
MQRVFHSRRAQWCPHNVSCSHNKSVPYIGTPKFLNDSCSINFIKLPGIVPRLQCQGHRLKMPQLDLNVVDLTDRRHVSLIARQDLTYEEGFQLAVKYPRHSLAGTVAMGLKGRARPGELAEDSRI